MTMYNFSKGPWVLFLFVVSWTACSDEPESILAGTESLVDFPVSPMTLAVPSGPYAHVLEDCTFNLNRTSGCTLAELPFLGMETNEPTIEDVMSRVLVSQPWMADNFRQALEQSANPMDFQLLARSVTAIVISDDIRPTFYWPPTGAMYLDAAFVWLDQQQFAQISQKSDPRLNYNQDLQFVFLWRWVKNNAYAAHPDRGTTYTGDRTIGDIQAAFASVMYHELAHANDFFPADRLSTFAGDHTPKQAWQLQPLVSEDLASQYPLQSDLLRRLAGVVYSGKDATTELMGVTAQDFVDEFTADSATHFYNHSNALEDFAMTFDSMMLLWRLGVQQDIGVALPPNVDQPTADDYVLVWGQRQRVADPIIREKAGYIIARILPELTDADDFIDQLDGAIDLNAGDTWAESIDPTGQPGLFVEHPPVQTLPIDMPVLQFENPIKSE